MPTAAELTVVIEAQDRASAQLRSLGTEVQRLNQQVAGSGGIGRMAAVGAAVGAGFAAATVAIQTFARAAGFVAGQFREGFAANVELERATISYEALAGSAGLAADALAIVNREAAKGFNLTELREAGRTLLVAAEGSTQTFEELLGLAERLAVADPAAGITSGAFAIREALSGDFQSLIERFEVSRVTIQRWKDSGASNIEIVRRVIDGLGVSAEDVERLGRTFEGRQRTIENFANTLRRALTAGVFDQVAEGFGHLARLIEEHGPRIEQLATDIGVALGMLAERAANLARGPLGALIQALDPTLWAAIETELSRTVEPVERMAPALDAAATTARELNRELAQTGLAAAEVQLESNRIRQAFAAQTEPLERQLRLLQQSADLQRVQNALAGNRAAVEGIRLEHEIAALEGAAGGAEDPAAEGLTVRQRLIALALQERRLRQEALGIEEQRRPALQSVEQQLEGLREQGRQALAPLEAQLQAHRNTIDALNIQRQKTELNTQKLQEEEAQARKTAAAVADIGRGPATPEALADSQARGEALADKVAEGFKKKMGELFPGGPGEGILTGIGIEPGVAKVLTTPFLGPPPGAAYVNEGLAAVGRGITVNVAIANAQALGLEERLREALRAFIVDFFARSASVNPGASPMLQGAGR